MVVVVCICGTGRMQVVGKQVKVMQCTVACTVGRDPGSNTPKQSVCVSPVPGNVGTGNV